MWETLWPTKKRLQHITAMAYTKWASDIVQIVNKSSNQFQWEAAAKLLRNKQKRAVNLLQAENQKCLRNCCRWLRNAQCHSWNVQRQWRNNNNNTEHGIAIIRVLPFVSLDCAWGMSSFAFWFAHSWVRIIFLYWLWTTEHVCLNDRWCTRDDKMSVRFSLVRVLESKVI